MDSKKEPGSNAPPLANRNQIDPGTGMMSQQPGTSTAESLDMWQTMNQVPSAHPGGPSGGTIPQMPGPLIGNSNPMPGSVGTNGPGGPTGTLRTDMYSNTQMQQPQQLTLQNPMSYQQQQLVMRQKLQQQQQQQQHQQQLQSLLLPGKIQMGGMQRNQMNSGQHQPVGQGGSFQQLTLMPQHQQQPQATMLNPSIALQQINNGTGLQQQQLQMQQNQQQSQMPQNQILNQHMLLGQQQGQMMGIGGGNMNDMQMQTQRRLQLLQKQQQQQQWMQRLLAQQQQQRMMQQMEMQQQQPMHRSSAAVQAQNGIAIDPQRQQQQQQLIIPQQQQSQRQQRGIADGAYNSASMDSTAQTRNPGDWQEEIHQKLKYLKETYLADLREIHQKLSIKLSQLDNVVLANARGGDQVEKMKQFKLVLERMMAVLQLGKQGLNIGLKDKLALYEKQILSILRNHKKVPQQYPPPRQSQPRKCKVCIDCVHKRRNS